LCKHSGGGREERAGLRTCHTRKGVGTVRFRCQKRYVAQKVSKKTIQPMGLRDKRVPFLEAPPQQVWQKLRPGPLFPSSRGYCISRTDKRKKQLNVIFWIFLFGCCTGKHVSMRNACEALPGAVNRRNEQGRGFTLALAVKLYLPPTP